MVTLGFSAVYLLAGAVGGTIMGIIGTGSSLITLPVLIFTLPHIFPVEHALRFAVGTTVATLFVGTFSSSIYCIKCKMYDKKLVLWLVIPTIAGACLAPLVSVHLPARILAIYVSCCLIVIGGYSLLYKPSSARQRKPCNIYFCLHCLTR